MSILTLETKKYSIKIDNFEGPLDLLCYLIDKNKMNIYDVNLTEITNQYIEYLNAMEEMNLEIASEFIVMASTLLYLKSKNLLPKQEEEEEEIKLPKQKLEKDYGPEKIPDVYKQLIERNSVKINQNAKNIEKIALVDKYTVADKVKEMYKVLAKQKKFVFNKLFSIKKREKQEVVTAFSGLLELSRRSKVETSQEEIFGDITVEEKKK